MTTPEMMFILGLLLIFLGTLAVAFPRDRRYLTRLLHVEIPSFGLLLLMLTFDETVAFATFIAVNGISICVLMRVLERSDAS